MKYKYKNFCTFFGNNVALLALNIYSDLSDNLYALQYTERIPENTILNCHNYVVFLKFYD